MDGKVGVVPDRFIQRASHAWVATVISRQAKLIGKFFNQNADLVVTEITVEAAPDDEKNIFNKSAPRLFAAEATAMPHSMSAPFEAETGALNPETHKLRIAGGRGRPR